MRLSDAMLVARNRLTQMHPGGRRWLRFLAEHDLDPGSMVSPIAPPGPADFIICGAPRSGTTLLAAALFQPPGMVTVVEPWAGMKLPPHVLFRVLRREIAETGSLRSGRLDVASLRAKGSVRRGPAGQPAHVDVDTRFLLGVKWPAFWRYLELLPETKFIICVRHPYEVISSFRKQGGRLGVGLEFDLAFNRVMNNALTAATADPALRRVLLYDYIHERILTFVGRGNVLVVRYETWFSEPDRLRADLSRFLGGVDIPATVLIRPPESNGDPLEKALIDRHCQTAGRLGYDLGHAAVR